MKKFTFILSRLVMVFAAIAMVACNNDTTDPNQNPDPTPTPTPTPELEVKMEAVLVSAGTSTAEIKLTTLNIGQYAYSVDVAGSNTELTPDIIFALGTSYECKDGENTVVVEDLNPATSYVVTIAGATVEDEFYEQVVKVELTTSSFTDELTFFDIDYMSLSAHFNFPKDKVQPGNVIKWGLVEFPQYFQHSTEYADAERINLNDDAYHHQNYITDSHTWNFSEENSYIGDPADDVALYSPIVPGQPMYLILGEFAYTEQHPYYANWTNGYYNALFDADNYWRDYAATGYAKQPNQSDYWSGYYRREFVESKAPSKMSAKCNVTMNLTPRGGKITITPESGIYAFCYAVVSPDLHMQILPLINNKASYMQWYITSYHSFMNGVSSTSFGAAEVILDEMFVNGMQQNKEYTLHITALGNDMGTKQSYKTHKFTLPKPTKPASKLTVKGIDNPEGENVWNQAWFNVKCDSGDAYKVRYIANYEREWMAVYNQYIKTGYTEAETLDMIISQYGAEFTADEVALINSAEGYNIRFDSRADANTFLGIRLMNDEGTITSKVGECRTVKEPYATPVNSSLFEELKGEWVATTTIQYNHYHYCQAPGDTNHDCGKNYSGDKYNIVINESDKHNYTVQATEQISSKVVIGEVGYEATLPDSVYELFFSSSSLKTKEEVDAVYDQFKTTVDDFNAATRGQNRILCQGFELEYDSDKITCGIPEHNDKPDGKLFTQYASPYELFIADADTYSAYNYESPVFDFGPKWYFEVGADGSLTVPFNTNYFAPMSQWVRNGNVYYLVGVSQSASLPYVRDAEGNIVNAHFPVTISADKNTITINPLRHTFTLTDDDNVQQTLTEDFYPNIGRSFNGQLQFYSRIVAPIVLTRKGTAAAQSANVQPAAANSGEVKAVYEFKGVAAPKSRTALPATNAVEAPAKVKYHVLSAEEFNANCKKNFEKRLGIN